MAPHREALIFKNSYNFAHEYFVMSRTRFRVNPPSIVAWMSRNSLLEAGVKSEVDSNWTRTQNHLVRKRTLNHLAKLASGWVFVYKLSVSGFESSCNEYSGWILGYECNKSRHSWCHGRKYSKMLMIKEVSGIHIGNCELLNMSVLCLLH